MASVSVDRSKCIGCGLCPANCPECFVLGDDGIAAVKAEKCNTCDLREVAQRCPVNAITVKE